MEPRHEQLDCARIHALEPPTILTNEHTCPVHTRVIYSAWRLRAFVSSFSLLDPQLGLKMGGLIGFNFRSPVLLLYVYILRYIEAKRRSDIQKTLEECRVHPEECRVNIDLVQNSAFK